MTSHIEQIEAHQVWDTLDRLEAALQGDFDDSQHDTVERVRSVARHVRASLDAADPHLLHEGMLNQINSPLNNLATHVDDPAQAGSIGGWINTLLQHMPMVWSARTPEEVEGLRDLVSEFRTSSDGLVDGLRTEVEATESTLEELKESAGELRTEVDEQKTRVDSVMAEYQDQFSTAQDRRSTEEEAARKERTDNFASQLDDFREQLKTVIDDSKSRLDTHDKSEREQHSKLIESANATITKLGELEEAATKRVGVIGNIGMTGDYQKQANDEQEQARRWAYATAAALLVALVIAGLVLMTGVDDDGGWSAARRIAFSLAAFSLAGWTSRQAAEHRRAAKANRAMELELASMEPYIAPLPPVIQQAMKTELATRYFRGIDPDADELDIDGRVSFIEDRLPKRKETRSTQSALDEDEED